MDKPRKGMKIEYKDPFTGKELKGEVMRVEGNLCWTKYEGKEEILPFIWRFHDGYNTFHKWS